MKRFILAILSILYMSSAIGASLHFRYCMDELYSWGFWLNEDKACGKCGMNENASMDRSCCKDEYKHIKLTVDQKSHKTIVYQFTLIQSSPIHIFTVCSADLQKQTIASAIHDLFTHNNFAKKWLNTSLPKKLYNS